jgi:hypothetical protein
VDHHGDLVHGQYALFAVRVQNVPVLNLLLTHSRLLEEICDSDCFKGLEAITDVEIGWELPDSQQTARMWTLRQSAMQRLKKATVYVTDHKFIQPSTILCPIYNIAKLASDLKTLKVALQVERLDKQYTTDTYIPNEAAFGPRSSHYTPQVINNLSLVQRGKGVRLSYLHAIWEVVGPLGPFVAHEVRVLLYTIEVADHLWWQQEDIISNWPRPPIPTEMMQQATPNAAQKLARLPFEMQL